jgi:hypothetical protein
MCDKEFLEIDSNLQFLEILNANEAMVSKLSIKSEMPKLKELDLGSLNDQLTEVTLLKELPSLEKLSLPLKLIKYDLPKMPKLKSLTFMPPTFDVDLPELQLLNTGNAKKLFLDKFPKLKQLIISGRECKINDPNNQLSKIEKLICWDSTISLPDEMLNLITLKTNALKLPKILPCLKQLDIRIDKNKLSLPEMPKLEVLKITNNEKGGEIEITKNLIKLNKLELELKSNLEKLLIGKNLTIPNIIPKVATNYANRINNLISTSEWKTALEHAGVTIINFIDIDKQPHEEHQDLQQQQQLQQH